MMSKLIKKLLSVSLCAALMAGTASIGSLSASATNGPMDPFEKTEVFDDGEETYHVSGGQIRFYPLTENGYYKWGNMGFLPECNYLYNDGETYNSDDPVQGDMEDIYYGGIKGAYYDKAANTLYLRNVKQPLTGLEITSMGQDFKISVVGECELAFISLDGYYERDPECSGLTITGNGVLTLNTSGFRSTFKPISAYVSYGQSAEGDVGIKFDKNVSVNLYGKEGQNLVSIDGTSCTDPALAIEAGNGQELDVKAERVSYNERLERSGVYMKKGGTYINNYIAHRESDPNGVYSVLTNNWNEDREEDEEIYFRPEKYKYIERFDAYTQDYSFESKDMTPEEFAASDYTIEAVTTPKLINYNSVDEPQASWHYVGYSLTNSEDTDSGYIYVAGRYVYGKTPINKLKNYRVYKLIYNAADDSYTRVDEPVFEVNDETFEQGGYSMVMEEGSNIKAKEVNIPVPDEEHSYYVYHIINNPDDPDGIYGVEIGFYEPYDPDVYFYIRRVKYNEEYDRYIEDEDFSDMLLASDYENSKYSYVMIDEPIGMQAYDTFYVNDVYKDKDGNKYTRYHSWDKDYVFTYSEDDLVDIERGYPYYALTPTDNVAYDDLEKSVIVREDMYNFYITGTELKYGSGDAGFANTSSVSAYEVVAGDSVTLNASSVGGTGDKTYALMYKKSGENTWKKIGTKYGTQSSGSFVADGEGTYEVMINVKDSTGKIVSASFTVTAVPPIKNTSSLSAKEIKVGSAIEIYGDAEDGLGPYTYKFYYKKSKNTDWMAIKDNAINGDTAFFTPTSNVAYDFKVIAYDRNGNEAESVLKLSPAGALKNVSTVSAETVMVGDSIKIHAEAQGGAGGYTYALLYKKSTSSTWLKIGTKYGTNPDGSFKPGKAVPYDIMVNVKDSAGTIKSKTFKINVTNALVNKSKINSESVKVGEKVVLKGVASGGAGNYTYSFFYKKSKNSTWMTISEDKDIYGIFRPTAATTYDAKVVAKDSAGNAVEKNFKITVTK